MRLRRYRPAALLMLALHLTGCSTWKPIPPSVAPGPVIETEEPSEVRVTLIDGSEARIRDPVATADSIYDPAHRGYAFEDLAEVSLRRLHLTRTLLLITATPIIAVGLFLAYCSATKCLTSEVN